MITKRECEFKIYVYNARLLSYTCNTMYYGEQECRCVRACERACVHGRVQWKCDEQKYMSFVCMEKRRNIAVFCFILRNFRLTIN